LSNIQNLLDKFVLGKLNVAKSRINLQTEKGGLGLLLIEDFLTAQKATWIIRAEKSCRDLWQAKIYENTFGNPLICCPGNFDTTCNPVLTNIAQSYAIVRTLFDQKNDNFYNAYVLNNSLFFRSRQDRTLLTPLSLRIQDPAQLCLLSMVTFSACFNEMGLKSRLEFANTLGVQLDQNAYSLLADCLNNFLDRFNVHKSDGTMQSLNGQFC